MPCALLYNIKDPAKLQTLRFILFKLGAVAKAVEASDYGQPIGALCGLDGFTRLETSPEESFHDEMLVLCGFPSRALDELLNTLRARHVSIALKAVVTEENAQWSSLHLHEELAREHEAMRALRANRAHPRKRK